MCSEFYIKQMFNIQLTESLKNRGFAHRWVHRGPDCAKTDGRSLEHCLLDGYIKYRLVGCKPVQYNNSIRLNRLISARRFTWNVTLNHSQRNLVSFLLPFRWMKVFVCNESTFPKPYSNHTITCVNRRKIYLTSTSSRPFITIHRASTEAGM